ncbi:MAG: hypothetical protein AAGD11_12465 [Planctomycetota bacterium]
MADQPGTDSRDEIYLLILHYGLLRLREAARAGLSAYCEVEADHLHNLPSLVGERNEHRHTYYFEKERTLYLERVDRSVPDIGYTLSRYDELWTQLADLRSDAT